MPGLARRVVCSNGPGIVNVLCNWSFGSAVILPAGQHNISVQVIPVSNSLSAHVAVSGASNTVLQGALTVMFAKP